MKKIKGIVTSFNDAKGYGFISSPYSESLFVHYTAISGPGFKTLAEGQEVEFKIITGPGGPQASEVFKLGTIKQAEDSDEA